MEGLDKRWSARSIGEPPSRSLAAAFDVQTSEFNGEVTNGSVGERISGTRGGTLAHHPPLLEFQESSRDMQHASKKNVSFEILLCDQYRPTKRGNERWKIEEQEEEEEEEKEEEEEEEEEGEEEIKNEGEENEEDHGRIGHELSTWFDLLARTNQRDVVSVVSERHEGDQGKGRRERGSERNSGRQLEGRTAIVRCHSGASDRLYAWKMGLVFIGIAWCTSCGRYALMFNAGPYWNCACTTYNESWLFWSRPPRRRPRVWHSWGRGIPDSPSILSTFPWTSSRVTLSAIFINRIISSVAPLG